MHSVHNNMNAAMNVGYSKVYISHLIANWYVCYSTHWFVCRYNADQNHKTGQMGCIAANMSVIDDFSLHPSVGPSSSPVGPSSEVEESTPKQLPSSSRDCDVSRLLLHD